MTALKEIDQGNEVWASAGVTLATDWQRTLLPPHHSLRLFAHFANGATNGIDRAFNCPCVVHKGGMRTIVSRIGRVSKPCLRAATHTRAPV